MIQIEVPDWVVARARAAVREFWENYKGGHDCGEFDAAMKAAISAALGAWAVPACYRLHQPNHSSEWISGMYGGPPMTHKAWSVEQTLTLRQEKPE